MGMIQRFGVNKGINSRVNKLFVKDGYVEDAQNVIPDVESDTIVGRPGKNLLAPNAGTNGLIETYSDLIKSKALYGMYSIGAKLYKWALDGLSWVDVGGTFNLGAADTYGILDTLEYDSTIYVAKLTSTTEGISRYAGNGLYLAGVPSMYNSGVPTEYALPAAKNTDPAAWIVATNRINYSGPTFVTGLKVTVASTGTLPSGISATESYYIKDDGGDGFFLLHAPLAGIYGQVVDFTSQGTGVITVTPVAQSAQTITGRYTVSIASESGSTIVSSDYLFADALVVGATGVCATSLFVANGLTFNSFKQNYATIKSAGNGANTPVTATTITFDVESYSYSVAVGDYLYLRNSKDTEGYSITAYKVTAVDSTLHKVTISNPDGDSIYLKGAVSNIRIDLYGDIVASGVYRLFSTIILGQNIGGFVNITFRTPASTPGEILTQDEFITEVPPRARYIEEFQGVMFLGNVIIGNLARPQSICFSNVDAVNYHIEKFDASYNEIVVGEDKEGAITGLKKNNDGLIIFKERAIYTLTGDVRLNNFIIRKVYGSTVGCIAHGSIQEVGDMIGFLSATGVHAYRIGLDKPIDMSISIYPDIIADASPYATSAYDFIAKRYFLHTGTKMYVFDLFGEGWWKWTNITADGGLCYSVSKDKVMLIGKDTSDSWELVDTLLVDDTSAGGTVAISKFIKSTWESLNKQEFQKKFKAVKIFCIPNTGVTLQVKLRTDWETTAITDQTVALDDSPYIVTEEVKPDSGYRQAKCMQVEFLHSSATEAFSISGWSLEYEPDYFESKKFSKAAP